MESTTRQAATDRQSPRIACIGAGYWGKNLVRNFKSLGALAWVCDPDPHRQAELAGADPTLSIARNLDQVLDDPSVAGVAIATPAGTHGELVMRALRAGKDVFVEKPLCLSVREGERLASFAAQEQRILMVGHLLWYHPAILKLQQIIEEGQLGRIQYICANRLNLGRIRREENILWSFAPHDISLILGLVGEMPVTIEAQGGNYLHERIADVTVSLLSFPSGVKAHVFVSWLHPFKEQKLVVVGDRQMAVFDDSETKHKLALYPHSIRWENHSPVANKAAAQPIPIVPAEPLREECRHFLDCVESRLAPRTDGQEGLRVLSVLQRCQEALEREAQSRPTGTKLDSQRRYFAHPSAFIDDAAEIGDGTTIWHVSHILKNTRIGKNCRIGQNVVIGPNVTVGNGVKIQNNVSVYEGVTLEDAVFCGPSMVFTNVINPRSEVLRMDELRPTLVRQGASLGANCTIVCGTTIGRYAFVGAGAVIVRDVPDFALMVGNPGRIIGWMCVCGNRIEFDREEGPGMCEVCRQTYMKIGEEVIIVEQSAFARPQSSVSGPSPQNLGGRGSGL